MSSTTNKQVKVGGKRKHQEMLDASAAVEEDLPHSS